MKDRWRLPCAALAVTCAAAVIVMPIRLTANGVARGQTPPLSANPHVASGALPAPARPPTNHPAQPDGYVAPTQSHGPASTAVSTSDAMLLSSSLSPRVGAAGASRTIAISAPAQARTWGIPGATTSTLVLYDTTNTYGWLGELYAMATGNLASHFGQVTAEPVVDYQAGQLNGFSATIYLGSTYNEPIPVSFLDDVLTTSRPVLWAGDNIWQLSGSGTAEQNFQNVYGWDPSTSYFDDADVVTQVAYNGQTLTRNTNSGSLIAPHITSTTGQVTALGQAQCGTIAAPATCAGIAQAPTGSTTFPWAITSANLTYIGEVPLSYITESDRYLAFSDQLFSLLAPRTPVLHQALVRLEDVSPGIDTPQQLKAAADYLSSVHVPFSVGVIPAYADPNGYYSNGTPTSMDISQTSNTTIAAFNSALRYMVSKGGTLIEHGYTHQYSNVANPYSGASGDDFEFYRAQCATTSTPPYTFDASCPNADWVIQEGPVPNDSTTWAKSRAATGQQLFTKAGFTTPTIWETPHYSASAADYPGIDQVFQTRYEREQFFGGQLSGNTADASHVFGQFFPYVVNDLYGETIVPENLGNYGPENVNNNAPKPPSYIIGNAQAELAVRQGVASFFFHPYYDVSYLQQIVAGIQSLGYTFVAPSALLPTPPAPAISRISPTTGPAAGGTQVTISGSGFAGASSVHIGSAAATIVSDVASQIVVMTRPGTPGTVDVTVTTAGGTSPKVIGDRFTYIGSTATSIASSANPVAVNHAVTFTASVVASGTTGTPTGTVRFTDNGTTISGCGAVALTAGAAACKVTYTVTGTHTIVGTYSGSAWFKGSLGQLSEKVR